MTYLRCISYQRRLDWRMKGEISCPAVNSRSPSAGTPFGMRLHATTRGIEKYADRRAVTRFRRTLNHGAACGRCRHGIMAHHHQDQYTGPSQQKTS